MKIYDFQTFEYFVQHEFNFFLVVFFFNTQMGVFWKAMPHPKVLIKSHMCYMCALFYSVFRTLIFFFCMVLGLGVVNMGSIVKSVVVSIFHKKYITIKI